MTSEDVREYFEYRDGKVYWKKDRYHIKAGARFGCSDGKYQHGYFFGKRMREHQLVWLLFNESLPERIDHIDNDGFNNRIENLRPANHSQNMQNAKLRHDNKTGCKGVFRTSAGTYAVYIGLKGKRLNLGTYSDLELACLVADEARDLYHGSYARYN
jgi:hypothetical protein